MSLIFNPNNVLFFKKDSTLKTLQIVNNSQNRFALSMACPDQTMYQLDTETIFIESEGNCTVTITRNGGPWTDSTLEISYAEAKDTDSNSDRVILRRRIEKMSHQILLKKSPTTLDPSVGHNAEMGFARDTMAKAEKRKERL